MAGGTWEAQNKVRAGVYVRFRTALDSGLTIGDRGTVAVCEPMSWGPVGIVNEITVTDDVTPFTGFDITNSANRFLREMFKGTNRTAGPKKVLLYRPSATSAAKATVTVGNLTATAKHVGTRGNDLKIIITAVTGESTFVVKTLIGDTLADEQIAATVSGLDANAWVDWSGSGALTASTGAALVGGLNGTVSSAAYSTFLTNIEPYKFDVLCYDGSDSTVMAAYVNFVKRIAEENGQYTQLVAANVTSPDSRFVINVTTGCVLDDGTTLTAPQVCWWVAGAAAGAKYNESLTYAKYPGAVSLTAAKTNSQVISALENGEFILTGDDGAIKVESDINSLVTYTTDIGRVYRKNRVMRLVNAVANDIYAQFSENYIGVIHNNETGRARLKAAIVGYLLDVQANNGIQNFTSDDVTVTAGTDIDAVVINIALQVIDSVEKVYMTIEVA